MKATLMLLLVAVAAVAQTKSGDGVSNVVNGKTLFVKNGCYQCHGYAGQGGNAGARLAQTKLPFVAFSSFVRNPQSGGMPPYKVKVMSDQELADVYAYIKTFPEPKAAKDIPLLNN